MSNRKFTFLDNIFWLHYGINVFHFQNRWQMIIFYMVSRQNEFSFIVKQSTQPDLFSSQTFAVYKLSWILLSYTLPVLQVTSMQGDSQDNQCCCWCWWCHVVPAVTFQRWELVVGKGRLLRHQLITFGAEMGREKVSLHSFSLAIEHVWLGLAKMLAKSLDFNEIWGHRR